MSDDESALLAAILADPDDDTPRLIFADALDEAGYSDRAEFIRVQCALAHPREGCCCRGCYPCSKSADPKVCRVGIRRRERELLESWNEDENDDPLYNGDHFYEWFEDAVRWFGREHVILRRGFVSSVTCTSADWTAHGDAILAAQPVRRVTLTTWPELQFQFESDGSHFLFGLDNCKQQLGLVRWGVRDGERPLDLTALQAEWSGVEFILPRMIGASWNNTPRDIRADLRAVAESARRLDI